MQNIHGYWYLQLAFPPPGLNEASNFAFTFAFSLTFTSHCFLVMRTG